MEVEKIDRINALAHKAKSVGLTEEEKKERELLRKEYIASVRMNLRAQDRKSTRLNSSHPTTSRMPSSA